MNKIIFQFEATGIQQYIMSSAKLKHMVAGSQLLEALTGQILDTVLAAQKLSEADKSIVFARRSGGVFLCILKDNEQSKAFITSWPLIVQQTVPGLKFSCASETGDEKNMPALLADVRQQLNIQKNHPTIDLPETTPVTQRNQKTGLAVTTIDNAEILDAITYVKNKTQHSNVSDIFKATINKWLPENESQQKYTFPTCFDHKNEGDCNEKNRFPFSGNEGEHYIAVVHADGNGMGLYIKDFMQQIEGDQFVENYKQFSDALDNATKKSAQTAVKWLINKQNTQDQKSNLAIRPLILSGDDVTFIIKANYALGFTKILIEAFEKESKKQLEKIPNSNAFPKHLTMSAGLVFLRSNQPFHLAYQLAESLCDKAKAQSRDTLTHKIQKEVMPSTLAFMLISNSLFEDAETQIKQEATTPYNQQLSNVVYALGKCPAKGIKRLDELKTMAECFTEEMLNISFVRKFATMLHQDHEHAKTMFNRWKKLNESNFEEANKHLNLNEWIDKTSTLAIADILCFKGMESQYD